MSTIGFQELASAIEPFAVPSIAASAAIGSTVIAVALWRSLRSLERSSEHIASTLDDQRHRIAVMRMSDPLELEAELARLLADSLGAAVHLVRNTITCAVLPAPYISATRADGARVFITQQLRLCRRLGLVRRAQRSINLTRGSAARRMTMLAVWAAVNGRADGPQPALPPRRDWHALISQTSEGAHP